MSDLYHGLSYLVRREPLGEEEWLGLIEARHSLIHTYLKDFRLHELGKMHCLMNANDMHGLSDDCPQVTGDMRFSLETKGIFRCQPFDFIERMPGSGYCPISQWSINVPNGTMLIWGLTESGCWVLVEVNFKGEEGYKGRGYERATDVIILETQLSKIPNKTGEKLENIWKELGREVERWVNFRNYLYREALKVGNMVNTEYLAYCLSPK